MKGPSITSDAIAGLSEKLSSVSESKFLDVIQYLSELQFPPVAPSVLPEIRKLMDKARPRLRELKPPRPITLTRLFCRPFEDLLPRVHPPRILGQAQEQVVLLRRQADRAARDAHLAGTRVDQQRAAA